MAVLNSGQLLVWGVNQNGLLGLGNKGDMHVRLPTLIKGLSCEQVSVPSVLPYVRPNNDANYTLRYAERNQLTLSFPPFCAAPLHRPGAIYLDTLNMRFLSAFLPSSDIERRH